MSANGISDLATKAQRQIAKLNIAQAKRQGKVVANDGTVTGSVDPTQPYYRGGNVYDITALPNPYDTGDNVNNVDETPNTGGLIPGRPWVNVVSVSVPLTIQEAVPGDTLIELESWYDASDRLSFIPSNLNDGQTFTQWTDKSDFSHNANPTGGANTRPTVQYNELNGYQVVRFDGINDGLSINPYPGLVNAPALTLFVVSKLSATVGFPKLFGQAQSFDMFYSSDTNSWKFNVNGSTVVSTGSNDNAWHIHTVAFDGSQSTNSTRFRYRRDKVANNLSFSINVPSTIGSTSALEIGNYNGSAQFMQGDIAEFIIFTRSLTITEIQNIENYLSNKWGL